jgi:hypothetical protein
MEMLFPLTQSTNREPGGVAALWVKLGEVLELDDALGPLVLDRHHELDPQSCTAVRHHPLFLGASW